MRKVISIPMTLVLFMMIALASTTSAQAGWQSDFPVKLGLVVK